jgi:hypothetical protein
LYATPLSEWSNKAFIAGAVWQKEQSVIPTDEEIEKKAEEYGQLMHDIGDRHKFKGWSAIDYKKGYKQALKDLGHKN